MCVRVEHFVRAHCVCALCQFEFVPCHHGVAPSELYTVHCTQSGDRDALFRLLADLDALIEGPFAAGGDFTTADASLAPFIQVLDVCRWPPAAIVLLVRLGCVGILGYVSIPVACV